MTICRCPCHQVSDDLIISRFQRAVLSAAPAHRILLALGVLYSRVAIWNAPASDKEFLRIFLFLLRRDTAGQRHAKIHSDDSDPVHVRLDS